MKRWIWTFVIFFGAQSVAQAAGVYVQLACRDNDPFVFCTQGCKGKDKNWTPISPTTGTWVAVPGYCPYPSTSVCCVGNVCFMPWTQTAVTAVGQYMSICPAAKNQGSWKGNNRPENVPYSH